MARGGIACGFLMVVAGSSGCLDPAGRASDPNRNEWTPLIEGDSLDGWYSFITGQGKNQDPEDVFTVKDGTRAGNQSP